MKFKNYYLAALLFGSLSLTSCSDNDSPTADGGGSTTTSDTEKKAVVDDYVDKVVLPTYAEMKEKGWTLYEKVKAFYNSTGTAAEQQQLFEACGEAWRHMRQPWEESEAFLFGPADAEKLDPSLDSWPLDQAAINNYVSSNVSIDYEDLQTGFSVNVKGFHTIEYLLFNNGTYADASQLSDRKKKYLLSITKLLRDNAIQLWAAWNGEKNLNERDTEVLNGSNSYDWDNNATEEGTAFGWGTGAYKSGYSNGFKTPSLTGNSFGYKTFNDCLDQVIDGCTDICTEVGEQKIGTPYNMYKQGNTEEAVYQVESWYSWNSLDDYMNNIRSIRNSYYGGINLEEPTTQSMSAYVKKYNANLDTQIRNQIETVINAIDAIPHPFRNHLNATTEIANAQTQLSTLSNLLTKLKAVWGQR